MSITSETVKFIAELELDAQDRENFLQGLKEADKECSDLREGIHQLQNSLTKLRAEGKEDTKEFQELTKTLESKRKTLRDTLWNMPTAQGTKITIEYPLHIRFLDMKKGRKGKRKKRYAPIYNKYVYGYLVADIRRTLNRMTPDIMINAFHDTFE